MNRIAMLGVLALLSMEALPARAEQAPLPGQYGDRQAGRFGDIDQGHFGNPGDGNFAQNRFPRGQEGQARVLDASPRKPGNSVPAAGSSPYITLPRPADAASH